MSLPQQRQSQESHRGCAAVCWLVAADKANNYYSRSRKLPWSVAGLTTSRRFHSELSKANVYITQNETTTANEKKCQYLCLSWNALKPQCRFGDNSIFANDQFYRLFFFRNTKNDFTEILHFNFFLHFFVQKIKRRIHSDYTQLNNKL